MPQTTDYHIFKKHEWDRPPHDPFVKRLMESIQQENFLHCRPIFVNADMVVLDGLHRLEAAKRLGLPIFYEFYETPNNKQNGE